MDALNNPIFQDARSARAWLEDLLWPEAPICGYCGTVGEATPLASREGYHQCNACRKQFTVMVGTVFERSHIPLNKWLMAAFLISASKKGISAHQMHRMLGVTYKTAWFMMHRLRAAMATIGGAMMGGGGVVEADETYFGKTKDPQVSERRRKDGRPYTKSGTNGPAGKRAVVSLVQRGGAVRSFHVKRADKATVTEIVSANVSNEAKLFTDESKLYGAFGGRETVNHSAGEYARGAINTNSVEGYFSIFKRGMVGVYQHCGEQHLQRYLAEFDFRYSNRVALGIDDQERTEIALRGAVGKRLVYKAKGERVAALVG